MTNTIAVFHISSEEDLRFQLDFNGPPLAGRALRVSVRERTSNAIKVDLVAPTNLTVTGANALIAFYPRASMSSWAKGIEYEADIIDESGGSATRIMAVRFVYDHPGNLVYGVKGNQASVKWGANQAVVTAIGGVGPPGPANSLAIGTVTTGAAGSGAAATITGAAPEQTLNLTIPRGDKGDKGDAATVTAGTTTTGPAGSSASVMNSGTSGAAVFDFTVPRGDTGATGPANTLTIGTVTTVAPGGSATATVTGTAPNQTLNLGLPRGDRGPSGSVVDGDKGDIVVSDLGDTWTISPDTLRQARVSAGYRSLVDEGGVGDDTANDTAAVEAAEATGFATYVPPGVYDTTISQAGLKGPFYGSGQIRDSGGNLRAPYFSAIDSEPERSDYGSILTAFNGDLSKVPFAVEFRITGAGTLGQPVTDYVYTPEATPFYTHLYNASGHNEELGTNIGRTSATAFRTVLTNVGQGDCMAYNFSAFVMGARPGATHFLANPAGSGLAGEVIAGSDGVYLNPMEINCDGGPYDCAGVTLVGNLHRDVATAAKGEIWNGFRVQSTGTAEVDSAFMMTGPHRLGLDLVHATFGVDKAAIAMKADDRHYYAATADSRLAKSKPTFGDIYRTYLTGAEAIVDVVNGVASWQVGATRNLSMVPLVCLPGSVAPSLWLNGMVTFALINNTTLQFSARGADGVTRSGNLTLS